MEHDKLADTLAALPDDDARRRWLKHAIRRAQEELGRARRGVKVIDSSIPHNRRLGAAVRRTAAAQEREARLRLGAAESGLSTLMDAYRQLGGP